ncbi:MAG: T9SS type A sorting domain-containing protein [Chitinophagales bacterium]|nr:T9SS type A sorting domain-containing protein [Chitinophagales bacterium]
MIRLTITYIVILISFQVTAQVENSENSKGIDIVNEYDLEDVYPNPFKNEINLVFQTGTRNAIKLYLYDIVGQIIHEKEHEISPNNNHLEINLEHVNLENGMYLLRIEKGKNVKTVRLVRK